MFEFGFFFPPEAAMLLNFPDMSKVCFFINFLGVLGFEFFGGVLGFVFFGFVFFLNNISKSLHCPWNSGFKLFESVRSPCWVCLPYESSTDMRPGCSLLGSLMHPPMRHTDAITLCPTPQLDLAALC